MKTVNIASFFAAAALTALQLVAIALLFRADPVAARAELPAAGTEMVSQATLEPVEVIASRSS